MKLQCLIKSRLGGKYNRVFDFAPFGSVSVVEDIADVSDECAAALVATGNFVRVDELLDLVALATAEQIPAPDAQAAVEPELAPDPEAPAAVEQEDQPAVEPAPPAVAGKKPKKG